MTSMTRVDDTDTADFEDRADGEDDNYDRCGHLCRGHETDDHGDGNLLQC